MEEKRFVLVVDDDRHLRKIIALRLRMAGYIVLEADSVDEARDRLSIKPAAIVLDIQLPDGTGWDVAGWLQTQVADVPIIVISGVTMPTRKERERFGPRAFLPKPFDVKELIQLLAEYVPATPSAPATHPGTGVA